MKLGVTVNVLNKFFGRKLKTSWSALVVEFGGVPLGKGGRPKGDTDVDLDYQDICDVMQVGKYQTQVQLAEKLGANVGVIVSRILAEGFSSFSEWQQQYHNHKVVSVLPDGVDDVYDLTVDKHHNFAANGVFVHNCAQDDKGRVLHVYSDNQKQRELLEDLFYNQLNVEFNMRAWTRNLPVHKDTPVPLFDGTTMLISDIAAKMKADPTWVPWVYSVNESTKQVVPGRVTWCDITRTDSELVRVKLDDGNYVDCTPDHEWLTRDGKRVRADQLKAGDSLMPFYRKCSSTDNKDFVSSLFLLNHKVTSVTRLSETSDVYCMNVTGPDGEDDRHNFAVLGKNADGQSGVSGVFLSNCKYGDLFLYCDVSPTYGVVNAFPVPVNEIEREENYDRQDPLATRFRWVTLGNRTLENWEIAHFRLLGNDMFLPYGASIIEPARRIWRQLILIEDAMMVYRVVRAPERRVFYIDVANIPPENVPMYIEEQRKNLRTSQVIDQNTGRVDLRYNPMCLSMKTGVKLQDGRVLRLDEVIKEFESGKELWASSVDLENNRIVPGKIVWAGQTRKDAELVRVTLDDGQFIDVTPDHRFMLRDGSYCEAKDLKKDQALMPLYTRVSTTGDKIIGYEKFYDPFDGVEKFTHRVNASFCPNSEEEVEQCTVHHVDYRKSNNNPTNLKRMNFWEHRNFHAKHCQLTLNTPERLIENGKRLSLWNKSEDKKQRVSKKNIERSSVSAMSWYNSSQLHKEHNKVRSSAMKEMWEDPDKKESVKSNMRYKMSDKMFDRLVTIVKDNPKLGRAKIHDILLNDECFLAGLSGQSLGRDTQKYSHNAWESELVRRGYAKLPGLRESILGYKNHKVASVEFLSAREDTGCVTVEKYHNFAACGHRGYHDNCSSESLADSFVYLHNSTDEDYFIPVRGGDSGTKIDTLAGGQNTGNVEDVAYIQKKLFAALKIPRAYLGYDDMLSCLVGNTMVPLVYGRVLRLDELAELFTNSDDKDNSHDTTKLFAHSYDVSEGKIVPGQIKKVWKTKEVTQLHRVTLDDGSVFDCTENHPFLCRDGSYKRADELVPGQSLMPLYKKLSSKQEGDSLDGYEQVLNNTTNEWEYMHKLVSEQVNGKNPDRIKKMRVVHHKNFNKLDNSPGNLQEMTWYEHRKLHAHHLEQTLLRPDVIAKREPIRIAALKSDKHRQKKSVQMSAQHADKSSALSQWVHGEQIHETMSAVMKQNWESAEYRELKIKQNSEIFDRPEVRAKVAGDGHWMRKKYSEFDIQWLKKFCKEHNVTSIKQFYKNHKQTVAHVSPVGERKIHTLLKENGYENWRDFACQVLGLYVPKRGCDIGETRSDFTIEDLKKFCVLHNVHNITQWSPKSKFSVADKSPVSASVINRLLQENGFKTFHDFTSTLKYNHKVVSVEVVNLSSPVPVYDMEVEKYHNFAVMTPYKKDGSDNLDNCGSFVFVHNSKATLAQEDIRFSRTINVIQKTIISELNKIAIIHLYAHGYDGEDLQNFTLKLSNPSTVAQQQKLELWRTKFEIAGSAPEGMVDKKFIRTEIFGLNQEQIDKIDAQRLAEKIVDAKIENAGTGEEAGGSGGGGSESSGGAEDLFGGGGEETGSGEESSGEEASTPPEENASDTPEEEKRLDVELLTSSDDNDSDESFSLKVKDSDDKKPVKPLTQLQRNNYNASRRRHHGPSTTHMPDFQKMTGNSNDSMKDPYDSEWSKSITTNPFSESSSHNQLNLSYDMQKMLVKMSNKLGMRNESSDVLTEGTDIQDEIDIMIDDNNFADPTEEVYGDDID
jgi:intein/homing endonuclease